MKTKILKSFIVISVFALMNCSENSSSVSEVDAPIDETAEPILDEISSSSSDEILFEDTIDISESSAENLDSVEDEVPLSSSALIDISSDAPSEISSSSVEAIEGVSSSEQEVLEPESSSSEAVIEPAGPSLVYEFTDQYDYKKSGPLKTKQIAGGAHEGDIIILPENLTNDPNKVHPVVIWGPGGGTPPGDYGMLMHQLASYGFVVYGTWQSGGNGDEAIYSIDWLERENENPNSPFYKKLRLDRIGIAGHSMGGLNAEAALVKDKRLYTAFLCNSGDLSGQNGMALNRDLKPMGIIYGAQGMERPNAENDYARAIGPAWMSRQEVAGREMGHGSGPWDGAYAVCAWMRWHIAEDKSIAKDFIKEGGRFVNRDEWHTSYKGWETWSE